MPKPMQNDNGKIRSEYMLTAMFCIAVAIFLTILIVTSSCEANAPEESSTPADSSSVSETSKEESKTAPVTFSKEKHSSDEVKQGALALTALPDGESGETSSGKVFGGDLLKVYNANIEKYGNEDGIPYGHSGTGINLRTDAWEALNRMTEAFRTAKGETNLMLDKGHVASPTDKAEADLSTGCSVLFSVYPRDPDGEYLGNGKYLWLADNCTNYGYILRYPAEKTQFTNQSGNDRQFRYVGYEHASYMGLHHLCLEEYLEMLRAYTPQAPLSFSYQDAAGNERSCEVYFVPVTTEGEFELTIRGGDSANISCSGNGSDGMIVTRYLD